MKTMTSRQLGGASDTKLSAETWEEMMEVSKAHAMKKFQEQDPKYLAAFAKMQGMMQNPEEMAKWMAEKKALFDSLPED